MDGWMDGWMDGQIKIKDSLLACFAAVSLIRTSIYVEKRESKKCNKQTRKRLLYQ